MLARSVNRSLKSKSLSSFRTTARSFHATPAIMVKVGDSIPDVELFEDSPGNKVNLSKELAEGKGVIIGVPAAFSPGCSDTHIPGYVASSELKNAGKVFVVSVNDAFVMKAWAKSLDQDKASGIRFLGDATGAFTKDWDVQFDATPLLGNHRSKRFAARTENGKVTKVEIEPDNVGIKASSADQFLAG